MTPQRIIVLFGGPSVERDVSRVSARTIVGGLTDAGFDVLPACIGSDGHLHALEASKAILAGHDLIPPGGDDAIALTELIRIARSGNVVAFPIVHGTMGEDGILQGLLEFLDVPTVGPSVLGSAVGMDKAVAKALLRDAGVPVTKAVVVTRREWDARREEIQREILSTLPLPLFAKPANGGSSVGVTKIHADVELAAAVDEALRYEDRILVEEGIDAREIECAILGGDAPRASTPGEIIPGHEFYDYEDKYIDSGSRAIIPADLPSEMIEEVWRLALLAAATLRVEEMARIDFFVERGTGLVFLNEVNTLPGFTSISMYPKLWEASGVPLSELLSELVRLAIVRFDRSRELRAAFVPPVALG